MMLRHLRACYNIIHVVKCADLFVYYIKSIIVIIAHASLPTTMCIVFLRRSWTRNTENAKVLSLLFSSFETVRFNNFDCAALVYIYKHIKLRIRIFSTVDRHWDHILYIQSFRGFFRYCREHRFKA